MRAEQKRVPLRNVAVSALCALLLVACGGSPESMVASAKDYLAKNDRNAASIQLKNALQKNPNFAEARYLLGKVNFDQGDMAGAEKELRRALDMGFSPDQVVPLLAQTLLATGQVDKVTGELGSQTLTQPDARASLFVSQGYAWMAMGKKDAGVQAFQNAIEAVPGFPPARVAKARLRALDRDLEGGLADVDAVLKEAPKLPEALSLRADILLAQERLADAIPAFEAVVAVKPTDLNAYQNLISLLLRQNKADLAKTKVDEMRKAVGNHPLVNYLQAYLDAREGRVKEAYEGLQQVLRVAPEYAPALMLMSSVQLQRQDFVQAQANLAKVLEKNPRMAYARRLMVTAYVGMREPARALEAIQPLLKENSDDLAVLNLAGQVYAMNGDFTRSEEYFGRAASAEPKNAQYRTRLGASRLAAGETDQAFADLEAASALDQNNIQADVTLIMAHLRRNETGKALEAVKVLEKKKPNDPITLNMKGGVLLASKDVVGARAAFEKALEVKPDFLPAVTNLARLDVADKKMDAARKRYEDFVSKNPKNETGYLQYAEFLAMTGGQAKDIQALLERGVTAVPTALPIRLALVRLLIQGGDAKRALSVAQEASAAAPDEPGVLELLGRAQIAAGEHQQALATFGKLSARTPNSPIPLIAMADIQVATKDLAGAEQSLRKALAIKADSTEAQQRLFAVLLAAKRVDSALVIAKDVQKQRKDSPAGYLLEGDALTVGGKKVEAVAAYDEAFKRDKSGPVFIRVHVARIAAGQVQEAAKSVTDWFKANPKDLVVRSYLAERNLVEQKYDQAVQQYRQMVEIAPKNPLLLNNLAWALGKMHDKSALEVAQRAEALAPNSPVVLDTLGMLLVESGDTAKGIETLKKAVSLGPNLPQLRLNLARAMIKAGQKDAARTELDTALKSVAEKTPLRAEIEKLRGTL